MKPPLHGPAESLTCDASDTSRPMPLQPLPSARLRSVIQVSSASTRMDEAALEAWHLRTRRLHAEHGITGILLYSDGCLMQCLEGEADDLAAAVARMRSSGLHRDIFELLDEAISHRRFPDWQMAAMRPRQSAMLMQATAAWKQRLGSDRSMETDGLALLRQFWENAR